VFKTTDGSGGNNVNLRITGAGAATFSSRVNVNGAPDDVDIAMVVKAPSGSGQFIMFGRNASDIAVFRISNTGETTANQFISCATDNGSGEYYFIKGNAAVSNNFSIYAYSNTLYYNSYSSMYFRANNTGGSGGDIIFSGGNVAVRTTIPSTVHTSTAFMFVGRAASVTGGISVNDIAFNNNAFYDGTNSIYRNNGFATSLFLDNSGDVRLFTAASGTAGGTVAFLEMFRLFNNGSLMLQNGGTFTNLASSRFTINSTTQGFLPPRGTNAQMLAIATPATGLVFYDTTNNKLNCYDGTTWQPCW
jgi:hypothetical protein